MGKTRKMAGIILDTPVVYCESCHEELLGKPHVLVPVNSKQGVAYVAQCVHCADEYLDFVSECEGQDGDEEEEEYA